MNPSTGSRTAIIATHPIEIPTVAPCNGCKYAPKTTPRRTIQKLHTTMNTGCLSLTVKVAKVALA